MNIVEATRQLVHNARLFLGPALGEVADLRQGSLPAREDIGIRITPETDYVPGSSMAGISPRIVGQRVDVRVGESLHSDLLSERGRDQLLAEIERQVEEHGMVIQVPDLSTFEPCEF